MYIVTLYCTYIQYILDSRYCIALYLFHVCFRFLRTGVLFFRGENYPSLRPLALCQSAMLRYYKTGCDDEKSAAALRGSLQAAGIQLLDLKQERCYMIALSPGKPLLGCCPVVREAVSAGLVGGGVVGVSVKRDGSRSLYFFTKAAASPPPLRRLFAAVCLSRFCVSRLLCFPPPVFPNLLLCGRFAGSEALSADEEARLTWLISETFEPELTTRESQLPPTAAGSSLIEVRPKKRVFPLPPFVTPERSLCITAPALNLTTPTLILPPFVTHHVFAVLTPFAPPPPPTGRPSPHLLHRIVCERCLDLLCVRSLLDQPRRVLAPLPRAHEPRAERLRSRRARHLSPRPDDRVRLRGKSHF